MQKKRTENSGDIISVNTNGEDTLVVRIKVQATIVKAAKGETGFVCSCPSLKVYEQGETLAEAKKNITTAVVFFIETCIADGILSETLHELGFIKHLNKSQRRQRTQTDSKPQGTTIIDIPIELPIAA